MLSRYTIIAVLIIFSNTSTFSQVQNVEFGINYIPNTTSYDCYFSVSNGFAESSSDRVFENARFSIKVETGTSISLMTSNLPLVDNEFYDGIEPVEWVMTQSVISPVSDPGFDYYSFEPNLLQISRFNDLFQNIEYNLFRIAVEGSCSEGVQIFKNGIDPGSNNSGMQGKDFSNHMSINSSSSLFSGLDQNIAFGSDLSLDDVYSCDGDCVTLEISGNCDLTNYTFLWSDGSTGSSMTICPEVTTDVFVNVMGDNGFSELLNGKVNYVEPFVINSFSDYSCIGSDTGFYFDGVFRTGTWVSNNPDIAVVNDNEESFVTAINEGVVSFTFTDDETGCISISPEVQVLPELKLIPLEGTTLKVGESLSLGTSELYGAEISWNVFPDNVAAAENGMLYGLKPGVCEVSINLDSEFACSSETISFVVEENDICNGEDIKIWNNVKIGSVNTSYSITASASSSQFFSDENQDCIIGYDDISGTMILHKLDFAGQVVEEEEVFINTNHDTEFNYAIEIHDMDSDGLDDIILIESKFFSENRLQVYRNLGNSNFELAIEESWCNSNTFDDVIEVADFDNDGFLDIFITCRNMGYQILFNDNWTVDTVNGNESVEFWVVPNDVNNDGFLDLAFTNLGVLINNGNRSFIFDTDYVVRASFCLSSGIGQKNRLLFDKESGLLFGHNQIHSLIDPETGTFAICSELYFNGSACNNLLSKPRFRANINSKDEKDIVVVSDGIFMAVNSSSLCSEISNGFKHFNFGGVADKYKQIDISNDGYTDFFYIEDNEIFASINPNSKTTNTIKGTCYIDKNENGIFDTNETTLRNVKIETDQSEIVILTDEDGRFKLLPPDVDYNLEASVTDGEWVQSALSISSENVKTGCLENNNFGFVQAPDIEASANVSVSNSITRCDFEARFYITVENKGNENSFFNLEFDFDNETTFMGTDITDYTIDNNTLSADLGMLSPFSANTYIVTLKMPSGSSSLPMLNFRAVVSSDSHILDEYAYMEQLRCSYDPNDKRVHPDREGEDNLTLFEEDLEYTIRFQNNGNDTAFTVRIVDPLDPMIDPSSITVVSSSHPVETCIDQDTLIFLFEDIYLVDSMTNYALSQGYVTFRCLAIDGVDENTIINNTADIIFDSNEPIITNTTINTLVSDFCDELEYDFSIIICSGESYNGYTESGNYQDVFTDINGCDSIVNLELLVSSVVTTNENVLVCQGDTIFIDNLVVTESTTIIDTLENNIGCFDSIQILAIQFVDKKEVIVDVEICEGEEYEGLTEIGQYTFDLISEQGCDSIVTLNLDVVSPENDSLSIVACEGDSIFILNEDYQFFETTQFTDTVFNSNNCAIAYTDVHVTIIEPILMSIDTMICEGENYLGLSETGTYVVDTTDQETGCLLTINVDLTVLSESDPACIVGTEEEEYISIELFPNPATHEVVLKSESKIDLIEIFDTNYRKLRSMDTNATFAQISIQDLTSGVYILRCRLMDQYVYKKLVVR